eukprot:812665-Pelagomonas_calceolata.AAC.4
MQVHAEQEFYKQYDALEAKTTAAAIEAASKHMEGESTGFTSSQEGSVADEYMQWLWLDIDWRRYMQWLWLDTSACSGCGCGWIQVYAVAVAGYRLVQVEGDKSCASFVENMSESSLGDGRGWVHVQASMSHVWAFVCNWVGGGREMSPGAGTRRTAEMQLNGSPRAWCRAALQGSALCSASLRSGTAKIMRQTWRPNARNAGEAAALPLGGAAGGPASLAKWRVRASAHARISWATTGLWAFKKVPGHVHECMCQLQIGLGLHTLRAHCAFRQYDCTLPSARSLKHGKC